MSTARTIAVIADLHYGWSEEGRRDGEIGDILLYRAVTHLNDIIKPDVTLLVGDLLGDGDAPTAITERNCLRDILQHLHGPHVIIPGNHDGDTEAFYDSFDRPPDIMDVAGMRVLPFIDEDRPGYCAARPAAELERFRRAREGFDGSIIALQHVPVFPDGAVDCPYNHVDAEPIIEAMNDADVQLCISGHYHRGHQPLRIGPTTLVTAPALYVSPFELLVIRLDGDRVTSESRSLAVDPAMGLCDYHIHTEFGYCAQDSEFARGVDLGRRFGMAQVGFAEHSGQLYFTEEDYWSGRCHREGVEGLTPYANRMDAYFEGGAAVRGPDVRVGLELDFDYQGRAVLQDRDRRRADYLLGSIHRMTTLEHDRWDARAVIEEFCWMVDAIVAQGVDVLAHPFRIIRRDGIDISRPIIEHAVEALHRSNTAAEINLHMGGPPIEFVTLCMERGVKLALGGDAHHLLDIGNFAPHLALLEEAGAPSDLNEVLFRLKD
ncbi:MAG: metallophosphoesterase [Kiritimatiellia bacterium]|jgi:histidinol phosphatase-like PHP family hydrolase/calcineurin-like phosphoesterase family protein|nr:metallophosphoesterase [Kiritimatiellia bacterium]MDP6811278.1 metallophosphoesterase [Kiritimatiellia bacterium]MDP7024108.1 metallophosphoesterase [Kiritimatiellia bacterium]